MAPLLLPFRITATSIYQPTGITLILWQSITIFTFIITDKPYLMGYTFKCFLKALIVIQVEKENTFTFFFFLNMITNIWFCAKAQSFDVLVRRIKFSKLNLNQMKYEPAGKVFVNTDSSEILDRNICSYLCLFCFWFYAKAFLYSFLFCKHYFVRVFPRDFYPVS